MKGGMHISPVLASVIIVIVLVVVGVVLWRGTGGHKGMGVDQQQKMREMMIKQGFGKPGERTNSAGNFSGAAAYRPGR